MALYQVILAYDGTGFYGFQRQAAGRQDRTVQAVVEDALRQLGWTESSIRAAGRTDTGVHASGQVAAFFLDWSHSTVELQAALNTLLPADVAVRSVRQAPGDFHPRYSALMRSYRYRIYCDPARDPLRDRYAWRVWPPAALDRMHMAAGSLLGDHDFAPFGTPPRVGGSTIRSITHSSWQVEAGGSGYQYDVTGNAFLYRMVRRMVAAMVEIGQRKQPADWIEKLLQGETHPVGAAGPIQGLAPARGLTLLEVIYPAWEDDPQDSVAAAEG